MKERIRAQYEGRRAFKEGAWKAESDALITPEVIREIYHLLKDKGAIPPAENEFIFVSPTANIPTHEATLFTEDSHTRTGSSKFFVGDISRVEVPLDDVSKKTANGTFQYFRWDAEHLPLKDETVDVIWDRKGWLWHLAMDGSSNKVLKAFTQYYRLLKPGGSIVVDAILENPRAMKSVIAITRTAIKELSFKLRGKKFQPSDTQPYEQRQYEPSTIWALRTHMSGEMSIRRELQYMFDITYVGEGRARVCVFTKRSTHARER